MLNDVQPPSSVALTEILKNTPDWNKATSTATKMPFKYKTVLMIGATSGIGAAMADRLIQEGCKVIAVGRRQDRLDAFVHAHGPAKAAAVRFDISDHENMDGFVTKVTHEHPDLDCVFLNAGTQHPVDLTNPANFDARAFHSQVAINFNSIVDLTMKFLSFLQQKTTETSLIYTGSHLAIIPAAFIPAYSASKAALNSFVLSLRLQLQNSSVKVIEISPPVVKTELHDYMGEEKGRGFGMPLDTFTDQAYAGLQAGKDQVVVGTVAATDADDLNDIYDKRRSAAERLDKTYDSDVGVSPQCCLQRRIDRDSKDSHAGTRRQADMQGLNASDYVSLETSNEGIQEALGREDVRKDFEKMADCYPIFCLTENIPKTKIIAEIVKQTQYWDKIQAHNNADDPLVEITSSDADDAVMIAQCKLNFLDADAVKPMPFVGWTVEACYDFFCKRLSICTMHAFTGFTFLAIDEQCVSAMPQEIIVGSDAGDYGEAPDDAPKLKVIRQPIDEIMGALTALEMQSSTPSEVACRTEAVASVMPPPALMGKGDRGRAYKRSALQGLPGPEEQMKMQQEKRDDGEDGMVVD
ncbi:MAG: hypothetical protein Q9181_005784 [Wetmoreana brouardii]